MLLKMMRIIQVATLLSFFILISSENIFEFNSEDICCTLKLETNINYTINSTVEGKTWIISMDEKLKKLTFIDISNGFNDSSVLTITNPYKCHLVYLPSENITNERHHIPTFYKFTLNQVKRSWTGVRKDYTTPLKLQFDEILELAKSLEPEKSIKTKECPETEKRCKIENRKIFSIDCTESYKSVIKYQFDDIIYDANKLKSILDVDLSQMTIINKQNIIVNYTADLTASYRSNSSLVIFNYDKLLPNNLEKSNKNFYDLDNLFNLIDKDRHNEIIDQISVNGSTRSSRELLSYRKIKKITINPGETHIGLRLSVYQTEFPVKVSFRIKPICSPSTWTPKRILSVLKEKGFPLLERIEEKDNSLYVKYNGSFYIDSVLDPRIYFLSSLKVPEKLPVNKSEDNNIKNITTARPEPGTEKTMSPVTKTFYYDGKVTPREAETTETVPESIEKPINSISNTIDENRIITTTVTTTVTTTTSKKSERTEKSPSSASDSINNSRRINPTAGTTTRTEPDRTEASSVTKNLDDNTTMITTVTTTITTVVSTKMNPRHESNETSSPTIPDQINKSTTKPATRPSSNTTPTPTFSYENSYDFGANKTTLK